MSPDYHMSDDLQLASIVVAAVVAYGLWALVAMLIRDVRANDRAREAEQEAAAHELQRTIQRQSVTALADDLFIGRDQHLTDVRDSMVGRWAA